jgi:hypothetical protein
MQDVIVAALAEWAYPQMQAIYDAQTPEWVEVSSDFYWEAMECVPPIYVQGGFMVGEALRHEADCRAVYAAFVEIGMRHFARYTTRVRYTEDRRQLILALANESRVPAHV